MKGQPQARTMLGALIVYQIAVSGPGLALVATVLTPLIHAFHWSHEQVAEIAFASTLTGGLVGFMVGYLFDEIGARWVMSAGLVVVIATLWSASLVSSLGTMVLLFALYGMGAMLSGILPVSVLSVNWFGHRRGLAGGVLWFALAIGMMATPPALTWLIAHYGWRAGFRFVCLPALLLGLPIALSVIRTRPASVAGWSKAQEVAALPGLELGPALSAAAFWLVLAADCAYSFAFGAVQVHSITYLIGLGYSAQHAAWVFSGQVCVSAIGSVVFGALADRIGARRSLTIAMLLVPAGLLAFTGAGGRFAPLALAGFILGWGGGAGCVTPLLPILLAESLGMRRLGTLSGMVRSGAAIATAFGPLVSGMIFDRSGSYVPAFYLAAAAMVVAAGAISRVRPVAGREEIGLAAAAG
ncbi:MAG TPA: MFS transporter [Candidatus Binataceae bacterium]|nr:MFS transporter [Candidatus Binataceae bacterium]